MGAHTEPSPGDTPDTLTAQDTRDRHGLDLEVWRNLSELILNHYGSRTELTARFVMIAIGTAFVWWLIRDPVGPAWCLAYFASFGLAWGYMRRLKAPASRRQYYTALALDMFQSLVFAAIIPYAAFVAPPSAAVGPFALVAAYAIYNIARSTPIPALVAWESALIFAVTAICSVVYLNRVGIDAGSMAAMGVTLLVGVYAAIVAWDSLRRTLSARELERRTIAAQRIEAVGQLSAGLTQELQTLLKGIQRHLENAEMQSDPARRAQSLVRARKRAEDASKQVQQLQRFSRKADVALVPVNLNGLLRKSRPLFESLLGRRRQLDIETPEIQIGALVDATAMQSAVANLVLNARDAGATAVRLTLRRVVFTRPEKLGSEIVLLPGNYAQITCADDGPGIPEALLDKVSQPFFSTKRAGEGAGLGLSMVRGTAEQMGGVLTIAQAPEGGAELSILVQECALADPVLDEPRSMTLH